MKDSKSCALDETSTVVTEVTFLMFYTWMFYFFFFRSYKSHVVKDTNLLLVIVKSENRTYCRGAKMKIAEEYILFLYNGNVH